MGAALSYLNILIKNSVFLIYTPLLIRFLGKSDYGMYQLTLQIMSTLSILALGFSGAYVRFYWQSKSESEDHVARLNGVYATIFVVAAALSGIIGFFLSNNVGVFFSDTFSGTELGTFKILLLTLVLNVSLTFVSTIFDSYITANQKFIYQQSRALIATVLQPVLTIPLIIIGFGIELVAIVQLLITLFFLIINVRYAFFKLGFKIKLGMKGSLQLFRQMAIFSSFLVVNDIVDIVNNSFPGLIVGARLGPMSVAIYSIAIQIRSIFFQLSLAISSVYTPMINKMVIEGQPDDSLTDLMIRIGRIQFLILSFVFGGFIIAGQYFIYLWAGKGFELSYWMIVFMIFPVLVPLSQNLGIEIQRAKNVHQFRSWVLGVLAVLNLLLTWYLTPKIGVIGSIYGYIFSVVLGNGILINWYNHSVVGLNMKKYWLNMIRPVLTLVFSVGITFVVTFWLTSDFLTFGIKVIVYVIVFILMWFLFGSNDDEKESLAVLLRRFKNG